MGARSKPMSPNSSIRAWSIRLVERKPCNDAVARAPDGDVVHLCPSPGDLHGGLILAQAQAVRVGDDTEKVASSFAGDQDVAMGRGVGHQLRPFAIKIDARDGDFRPPIGTSRYKHFLYL